MVKTFKKLALGIILIVVAGGILLSSDKSSRRKGGNGEPAQRLRVAIVQQASIPALDEGVEGVIQALAERGYSDGGKISIKHYNAEADIGTANSIAREVTSGGNDLIISISTTSLQTVANANRNGSRTTHVFGIVSDPYAAGVGIDPSNHSIHPPYMAGYGSMQPIQNVFETARAMQPKLKTVGLVWNAAEANSLAQTKVARKVCSELGITLLEANAENSSAALEALNSLISRGVETVWLSGDITVSLASESIINSCKKAGIPTFSSIPPKVSKGALFDLGANYSEIGLAVGKLAADILEGTSPENLPVENYVPKVFYFNETVLPCLAQKWVISKELRKQADGWITTSETNLPTHTSQSSPVKNTSAPKN
jgi:putative ABC transport system substrate-binding protein